MKFLSVFCGPSWGHFRRTRRLLADPLSSLPRVMLRLMHRKLERLTGEL